MDTGFRRYDENANSKRFSLGKICRGDPSWSPGEHTMLGLGLAASHAPSMFRGAQHWGAIHKVLTDGIPQPAEIASETSEVLHGYVERIENGFNALKKQ